METERYGATLTGAGADTASTISGHLRLPIPALKVAVAERGGQCNNHRMDGSGVIIDEATAFAAMQIFLEAYWERGGRASDDVAALLGSLAIDPAQISDWSDAVKRAMSDA